MAGRFLNETLSFVVFTLLDLMDIVLCYVYKVADFFIEAEWKPCYCSSGKDAIASGGKILVSELGESKIVRVSSSRLQLEEISDTLYQRPSLVSEVSESSIIRASKRQKADGATFIPRSPSIRPSSRCYKAGSRGTKRFLFLDGRIAIAKLAHLGLRLAKKLFSSKLMELEVRKTQDSSTNSYQNNVREDVVFIHGFISSSAFWTETLYPNFSKSAKSKYRFLAVDLLGFGRSPKPTDSLYTLREHVDMIERSVLEAYKVKSFHIVAHSLGCILALALAVKHPGSVKSLTLLAPPYFSNSKGRKSHTIYDEKSGAEARVAGDRVWRVNRLLVRAHKPDHLPSDMQEPPAVGVSRQTTHQKQVRRLLLLSYIIRV
ncbi:putative lysophospholipase BODYGUARD 2 [Sesamum angolense]|uniref:Lysophospholipase BODYGUARD 2 n=1 Tax=Sesamum angolense TaxID=2727404 RepID=A0AAE1T1A6_9LAMI|nr:putative lysophospholipase BODYGUARD 2 [Sesamum angolense]